MGVLWMHPRRTHPARESPRERPSRHPGAALDIPAAAAATTFFLYYLCTLSAYLHAARKMHNAPVRAAFNVSKHAIIYVLFLYVCVRRQSLRSAVRASWSRSSLSRVKWPLVCAGWMVHMQIATSAPTVSFFSLSTAFFASPAGLLWSASCAQRSSLKVFSLLMQLSWFRVFINVHIGWVETVRGWMGKGETIFHWAYFSSLKQLFFVSNLCHFACKFILRYKMTSLLTFGINTKYILVDIFKILRVKDSDKKNLSLLPADQDQFSSHVCTNI